MASRRRRGRAVALAVAAVIVGLVVATFVVVAPDDPAIAVTLDPEVAEARAPIEATLTWKPWGTEIRLDVRGLPEGEPYVVWLREPDDDRYAAGSFTSVSDGDVVLASSLPLDETAGIGISDADGETMLYGHLPED